MPPEARGAMRSAETTSEGAARTALTTLLAMVALGCTSTLPAPSPPIAAPEQTVSFDAVRLIKGARRDVAAGRHERAQRALLELFDHGFARDESSVGVIVTSVPSLLVELGRDHPASIVELRLRKDRIEHALRAGQPLDVAWVLLYAESVRALGSPTDGADTCRRLPHTSQFERQREVLCLEFLTELVDSGGAEEALALRSAFLAELARDQSFSVTHPDWPDAAAQNARAGRLLTTLLSRGDDDEAITFASSVLASLPWAKVCMELMKVARAAGRPDVAAKIRERARAKLTAGELELLDELLRAADRGAVR